MKRQLDGFVWIGLGIALILALFLSPFTSTSPDGLEKVAETKGFAEKGETWKFWKQAPLPDYNIPWINNEKVSTALSGLIGTLAIFFIAFGIGKLIKIVYKSHFEERSTNFYNITCTMSREIFYKIFHLNYNML